MIKPGGTLGIIVSNSWLGTKAGIKLVEVLKKQYKMCQVHISGNGRWFKNADVVTTILVLEKIKDRTDRETVFWVWKESLSDLENDSDSEDILVNSALLEKELNPEVAKMSKYTQTEMDSLLELNVSYNALFHDVKWLLNVRDVIIPISEVFRVFRGSRRGWDALFYPQRGAHNIEPIYLRKVLFNARNVDRLIATADGDAFCCGVPLDELKSLGHIGAIEWIEKFEGQRNGVGKPLPEVLNRRNMEWYELQENEIAEIFTTMNPDQRLFFAKFDTPSFINQRLIGLTHKTSFPDEELGHV